MTPSEATAVARLPLHWRNFVRRHYRLPKNVNLALALRRAGVSYLDLVRMFVSRRHARVALSALIGRPVAVGPRPLLRYRINGHPPALRASTCWRDRRICWMSPTYQSNRYDVILRTVRPRTPRGLHRQGVPWRALHHMVDAGHMRVEP